MEIHIEQKEQNKKQKRKAIEEGDEITERRVFDREVDL